MKTRNAAEERAKAISAAIDLLKRQGRPVSQYLLDLAKGAKIDVPEAAKPAPEPVIEEVAQAPEPVESTPEPNPEPEPVVEPEAVVEAASEVDGPTVEAITDTEAAPKPRPGRPRSK